MSRIVLFGAGGRFGRIFLRAAVARGHEVTAAVRDPDKYLDLAGFGARVVRADALDPASVATAAVGHDVAIDAIQAQGSRSYLADAAAALLDGLAQAGVHRLLVVGGAGSLEVGPGQRLVDTPEFREEWKPLALAHADCLDFLRQADTKVDWLYVSPGALFQPDGERAGSYRVGGDQLLTDDRGHSQVSYADFADALLDEIAAPKHHRRRITVAD